MTHGRVIVVGSLNADLTVRTQRFPRPGETLPGSELVTAPGGKGANQAAAAGILGAHVSLIGAVGTDSHAKLLLAAATSSGVDVTAVWQRPATATGTAMIVVDDAGENTIIVSPGANATLTPQDIDPAMFTDAVVVCLCLEIPLDTVLAAAQAGRDAGAQVVLNLSPYQQVPPQLLDLTDVLLVNIHEAALLLGAEALDMSWSAILKEFTARGLHRAVVTLGGDGAVVLDATAAAPEPVHLVAPTRVEVVDTTGCGDAFTASLAHRLAAGSSLVDAAEFAAKAGALAATRPGAQSSYEALRAMAG